MHPANVPPFLTTAAIGAAFTAGNLAQTHLAIGCAVGLVTLVAAGVSLARSLGILSAQPKKRRAARRTKAAPTNNHEKQ